jgi:hypothetical protein
MKGRHYILSIAVSLAVAVAARSQSEEPPANPFASARTLETKPAECKAGLACKVYSLSDLGDDPKICKWIAETIPEMIQPVSWKQADVKISFYAPSKILVINNTPAVHAQVEEFLQSMRKSVTQHKAMPGVMQAQFTPDAAPRAFVPTGPSGYPVPTSAQSPKHLFHFIIRYEGAGIIDSNVVKMIKAMKEEKAASSNESPKPVTPIEASYSPAPVGGMPPPPPQFGTTGFGPVVPNNNFPAPMYQPTEQLPAIKKTPIMPAADTVRALPPIEVSPAPMTEEPETAEPQPPVIVIPRMPLFGR